MCSLDGRSEIDMGEPRALEEQASGSIFQARSGKGIADK